MLPSFVRLEQQTATVARLEAALACQSERLARLEAAQGRLEAAQLRWVCAAVLAVGVSIGACITARATPHTR